MIAIFRCTASAANDHCQTCPEFVGRTLCITLGRWTFEFTLARRKDAA